MKPNMGLILPTGFKMDLPRDSPYDEIARVAVLAEELGYQYLWSFDHLLTFPDPTYKILEPWSVISALARDTKKVRLGTLVTCVAFRNPGLLAKIVTTVDLISKGRVDVGIGAGWWQPEFEQFGFQTFSARVALFEEYIQILDGLLSGQEVTFNGQFFKISRAKINPPPIQKPSIPIWVGATRPKMLRIVARYAKRWNMRGTPEYYNEEKDLISRNLKKQGRSAADLVDSIYVLVALASSKEQAKEIASSIYDRGQRLPMSQRIRNATEDPGLVLSYLGRKTGISAARRIDDPAASDVIGSADECVSKLSRYVDLGVGNLFVYLVGCDKPGTLETFTDKVVTKL
jgi:alkanesulfonate monooxygenase SsuD/methylene tetrahydromethanopterin reductase-like flavin-dependent oxidoreductase (luciferase family)